VAGHLRGSSKPLTTKRVIGRALVVGAAGAALYVVLPSLAKVFGAWPRLSSLSPIWLVGAFVAESASFGCAFALQRLFLRTRGWFAVICAGITGNAVTDILPAGDAVGGGVQFEMLRAAGIDADSAAGGLAASSMLGVGALLALPIFTLPAIVGGSPINRGLQRTAFLGLGGLVLFAMCGLIVLATDKPLMVFGGLAQRVWNTLARPKKPLQGFDRHLLDERDAIRTALGQKWRQAVLLTTARLTLDYASLLFALRATGSDPRPSLVLLAYAATGILAFIPITPGGLGVVEAGLSSMLILAGVSPNKAFLATLAYRLCSYWLPLLAGPVAYFLFRRRYGVKAARGHTGAPKSST
jgi:uncharacterized protein (TIRG00374 family)